MPKEAHAPKQQTPQALLAEVHKPTNFSTNLSAPDAFTSAKEPKPLTTSAATNNVRTVRGEITLCYSDAVSRVQGPMGV